MADIILLAETEVGKLFITEAFDSVKFAFFLAKVELINARNAYKAARKVGTVEAMAALELLQAAMAQKELMESLKDQVELMKEGIKELLEGDFEMGIGKGPKEENPSIMNKLESNGIGNGLIKHYPVPDNENTEAEAEVETVKKNGKSQKDKKEKTNNGKNGK